MKSLYTILINLLTGTTPTEREASRKHRRMAKRYGFIQRNGWQKLKR